VLFADLKGSMELLADRDIVYSDRALPQYVDDVLDAPGGIRAGAGGLMEEDMHDEPL
jgi:hypothetical protein